MKKRIIAALVGGIIIFIWQASSWMFLGIHDNEVKYYPESNEVLQTLSKKLTEDGTYSLPSLPTEASQEEREKLMKDMQGKPAATITYIKSFESNMTRSMIRGYLVDVFLVFLLIYIITRGGATPSFMRVIAASVSVGLFTWLYGPYMSHIWMLTPMSSIQGLLIDSIVAWGLCGVWLGWFLNRRRARV